MSRTFRAIRPEVLAWPEGVFHETCDSCKQWYPCRDKARHRCTAPPKPPRSPVAPVEIPRPAPVAVAAEKTAHAVELEKMEQRIMAGYWPEGMGKGCFRCKSMVILRSGRPDCKKEKCKPDVQPEDESLYREKPAPERPPEPVVEETEKERRVREYVELVEVEEVP